MQFTTLGTKSSPAVLLIHGMLCTADDSLIFGRYLADRYYVIAPTLDGHGDDGSTLVSAEEEARKIIAYLKENGIRSLALIQGSSMGAEVALAVLDACRRADIEVGHCFFDGGPFFDFHPVKRFFMTLIFSRLIKVFENEPDKALEKLKSSPFVRFVLRGKIADMEPLLRSMAERRRTYTDRTVKGMVKTCYNCALPDLPCDVQRTLVFFFSMEEPARTSKKRLKAAYPMAKYRDIRGYGHCSFQFMRPKRYARLLKDVMAGSDL